MLTSVSRNLALFTVSVALSLPLFSANAVLTPYQNAIENKETSAPALQSLLKSNKERDQIRALHALSLILTPASERALVDFRERHLAQPLPPKVYAELYAAFAQHALDKPFTADGGAATKAALADEANRVFAPNREGYGPVRNRDAGRAPHQPRFSEFAERPSILPGFAVAELATAIAQWGFADPHPAFLSLFSRLLVSAYATDEAARGGAIRGWMRARYTRFGQLPADAPTPDLPPELVRLLSVEHAAARTIPYLRAVFFAASHWKVPLPLLDVETTIQASPDRDTRLSAFDQLTRITRDGVAPFLTPYLENPDRLIRLNAFEALARATDGPKRTLLDTIAAEEAPSERAEMVRLYLASDKASKTPRRSSRKRRSAVNSGGRARTRSPGSSRVKPIPRNKSRGSAGASPIRSCRCGSRR